MQSSQVDRAVAAATEAATSLGLVVHDAVVLHESNAVTLRLLPCDVVARVSVRDVEQAQRELDLAATLATVAPVAAPDPRVPARARVQDGSVVTFWAHQVDSGELPAPADYARGLVELHRGMRSPGLTLDAPRFTGRVDAARALLLDRTRTPDAPDDVRATLLDALAGAVATIDRAGRPEQLLHGEPHPGNVLSTPAGLRFVDWETCCRGPVELDVAHALEEVAQHYPGVDPAVLRACRIVMYALIVTWRWDRDDRLPDRERLAREWFTALRGLLAD